MASAKSDKISLQDLYENHINFSNIVSVLPFPESEVWETALNNLVLKKIEGSLLKFIPESINSVDPVTIVSGYKFLKIL